MKNQLIGCPLFIRRFLFSMVICAACIATPACYSPMNSQQYFVSATTDERILEPIYSTALYTVYYDYVLARCVIHSAHTWGQNGGGGGGTGIGISTFRCDPERIRGRANYLGVETSPPKFKRHSDSNVTQPPRPNRDYSKERSAVSRPNAAR